MVKETILGLASNQTNMITEKEIEELAIALFPLIENDDSYGDYVQASKRHGFQIGFQKCQELNEPKWINFYESPPIDRFAKYRASSYSQVFGLSYDLSELLRLYHNGMISHYMVDNLPLPIPPSNG